MRLQVHPFCRNDRLVQLCRVKVSRCKENLVWPVTACLYSPHLDSKPHSEEVYWRKKKARVMAAELNQDQAAEALGLGAGCARYGVLMAGHSLHAA